MREFFLGVFAQRTTAEWEERLTKHAQRFGKVRTHDEVVADPQTSANGYIRTAEFPEVGEVNLLGCPIMMSDTPTHPGTEVPELGQDTEIVLVEAGFDWDELEELRAKGAW